MTGYLTKGLLVFNLCYHNGVSVGFSLGVGIGVGNSVDIGIGFGVGIRVVIGVGIGVGVGIGFVISISVSVSVGVGISMFSIYITLPPLLTFNLPSKRRMRGEGEEGEGSYEQKPKALTSLITGFENEVVSDESEQMLSVSRYYIFNIPDYRTSFNRQYSHLLIYSSTHLINIRVCLKEMN